MNIYPLDTSKYDILVVLGVPIFMRKFENFKHKINLHLGFYQILKARTIECALKKDLIRLALQF